MIFIKQSICLYHVTHKIAVPKLLKIISKTALVWAVYTLPCSQYVPVVQPGQRHWKASHTLPGTLEHVPPFKQAVLPAHGLISKRKKKKKT